MSEIIKTCCCPVCKKLIPIGQYRPFCSKRCADVDLGNWFNESYRVEAVEIDEQDLKELEEALSKEDEAIK